MRYVSIDIETTGLDPDRNQILEFAAVIEDWKTLQVDDLPFFVRRIYHPTLTIDAKVLEMNLPLIQEISAGKGEKTPLVGLYEGPINPDQLYRDFYDWCCNTHKIFPRVTAAGKNFSGFDKRFLLQLSGFEDFFHHRSIDPAIFFWIPQYDFEMPSTNHCLQRAELNSVSKHRALDDARDVIRLVRAGISRMREMCTP